MTKYNTGDYPFSYIVPNDVWMRNSGNNNLPNTPKPQVPTVTPQELRNLYDSLILQYSQINKIIQDSNAAVKSAQDAVANIHIPEGQGVDPRLLDMFTKYISTTPQYPVVPTEEEVALWKATFGPEKPIYGARLSQTGTFFLLTWDGQDWQAYINPIHYGPAIEETSYPILQAKQRLLGQIIGLGNPDAEAVQYPWGGFLYDLRGLESFNPLPPFDPNPPT